MPKLEARVKDSYRRGPVTAFSGREYVRSEWRMVPVGFEPAAKVHPLLEVREFGIPHPVESPVLPEPAPAVTVETIIEEAPARPMTVDDYKTLTAEPPAAVPPAAPKEEPVKRRRKSGKE